MQQFYVGAWLALCRLHFVMNITFRAFLGLMRTRRVRIQVVDEQIYIYKVENHKKGQYKNND